jgi:hypothetical protein
MATKEEIAEAIQAAKDAKDRAKAEKAYNDASSTPPAPATSTKKLAKGGVTRGDGCVSKGHTKGTMVKMAYGGKC